MKPIGFISPQHRLGRFSEANDETRTAVMSQNAIEKRTARRYKVLKGATIAFDGSGVSCTVRNLSSKGAALDFASSISLPSSFMLVIESEQFIRRCHPVWSHDKRIGIEFD